MKNCNSKQRSCQQFFLIFHGFLRKNQLDDMRINIRRHESKYYFQKPHKHAILYKLPPLDWCGKGVCQLDILSSFLLSVMASVVAYYICKWLDGDQ